METAGAKARSRPNRLFAAGALAVCLGCGGLGALLYGAIGTGALATGLTYGALPLVMLGIFLVWASRR